MKIAIKSVLYGLYFVSTSVKNYLPVVIYLLISQLLIMKMQNLLLVFIFFLGYLVISSPIALNIFRNIILEEDLVNDYVYFLGQSYTVLFIKKIFYLLVSIIGIYVVHIILLSPLLPSDISQMTIYLYVLFMYMLYIYTRIMFILPAASQGISKGLKDSYTLTKGRSIKIYFSYVIIIAPHLLINTTIAKYAELNEYSWLFIIPAIIMQVFFTILSSSLIGYIYKDFLLTNKDMYD